MRLMSLVLSYFLGTAAFPPMILVFGIIAEGTLDSQSPRFVGATL